MSLYKAIARKHPIQIPSNGTLTLERVSQTEFVYNPATGNDEPVKVDIAVKGFFRRDGRSQLLSPDASLSEEMQLVGILQPEGEQLSELNVAQTGRLELNDPSVGGAVVGTFVFQVDVNPLGAEFRKVAGIKVHGVLVMEGSGEKFVI